VVFKQSSICKLLLLINTVKYLKWQQIYFRLVRKFVKPKITDKFSGSSPKRADAWEHLTLYEEKIDRQLNTCFLNQSSQLDLPADWNNEDFGKLWVYNLHYFEDLLSNNAEEKHNFVLQFLNSWIDENPVGYGNGWEPYPTSLRIVNILKAWLGGLALSDKLFESVHSQASYLSNDLEKHLLGNHYFVNLKALLFAGVIFENIRWLSIAEKGLLTEISEQIHSDGANFELSPMYHSLSLVDMLDLLNLSKAYPNRTSNQLASLIEEYIPKMLNFMRSMAHPDGGVSFFNDSVNGIAPTQAKIDTYSKKLGFEKSYLDLSKTQIIDNVNSGYICATSAGNKLIFDASPVGPDYIPGHAHADTLSFEMSVGCERVFVNTGISEYGLTENRINQRKTRSHNTVEVDGKDSSEVWSGFRVANRAFVVSRLAQFVDGHSVLMQAKHDGYKTRFGGCFHTRKILLSDRCLTVTDSLEGAFKSAKSRFFIHPELGVSIKDDILLIIGSDFVMSSKLIGKSVSISDSFWHPEFGISIPNKVLEIEFESSEVEVIFTWSIR
jgi:uncharacterized heparinase superfamily protein